MAINLKALALGFEFRKYNATGNDFVLIDNRYSPMNTSDKEKWARVCDRKRGIGADGVIFLEESKTADFKMTYLNADGNQVEMCGNGTRSIIHFAHYFCDFEKKKFQFETLNSTYHGELLSESIVKVKMAEISNWGEIEVSDLYQAKHHDYLKVGVPHCVFEIDNDPDGIDLKTEGSKVRYDDRFSEGTNANFVQIIGDREVKMRTYERGVEGETLSCGTGTVACALSLAKKYSWKDSARFHAPGGVLTINFNSNFDDVWMEAEVLTPFSGHYTFNQ